MRTSKIRIVKCVDCNADIETTAHNRKYCQQCRNKRTYQLQKEYQKEWRANNPNYMRQWKTNNRGRTRQYYHKNKHKYRAYNKQWEERNKERRTKYMKQWYEDNKGRRVYRDMRSRCYDPKNHNWNAYGNKGIKVLFDIDEFVEWFDGITQCQACNKKFIGEKYEAHVHRKRTARHYSFANCVKICSKCHQKAHKNTKRKKRSRVK